MTLFGQSSVEELEALNDNIFGRSYNGSFGGMTYTLGDGTPPTAPDYYSVSGGVFTVNSGGTLRTGDLSGGSMLQVQSGGTIKVDLGGSLHLGEGGTDASITKIASGGVILNYGSVKADSAASPNEYLGIHSTGQLINKSGGVVDFSGVATALYLTAGHPHTPNIVNYGSLKISRGIFQALIDLSDFSFYDEMILIENKPGGTISFTYDTMGFLDFFLGVGVISSPPYLGFSLPSPSSFPTGYYGEFSLNSDDSLVFTLLPAIVPEPSTYLLMGGMLTLAGWLRNKKKALPSKLVQHE